jgi:hypothetical protein
MPRYYFNFRNGVLVRDPSGLVFPNLEAAADAARVAVENVSRSKFDADGSHLFIEITEEGGKILATIKPGAGEPARR